MPISAIGNNRTTGFTLIELMVVLTVLGFATATVLFTMPDPRGDLRAESERFAARANAAQSAAIIEGHAIALVVRSDGYEFRQWRRGRWIAIDEPPLRNARWQKGTTVRVTDPGRTVFDTLGGSEPLNVALSRDEERSMVRIGDDGMIRAGQ